MHCVPYKTRGIVMVGVAGMMGIMASGIERNSGASSSLGRGSKKPGFQHTSFLFSFSLNCLSL